MFFDLIHAAAHRCTASACSVCAASVAAALLVPLCGCGHNAVQYSDGIGINAGFDPEHLTASFTLRYGKILSVAARDMFELEMSGEASGSGEAAQASATTSGGIRVKIGRQVNGAARDLIQAGATSDQIRALLDTPASD